MTIGKIKLTQEQADAIEKYLQMNSGDIAQLLNRHADTSTKWCGKFSPLNGLDQSDMARALLIGYKVEPTFKVGEWATFIISTLSESRTITEKIQRIDGNIAYFESMVQGGVPLHHLKHSTSEEIKAAESEFKVGVWKRYGKLPYQIGEITALHDQPNLIMLGIQDNAFHHSFQMKSESFFKSELSDVTPEEIKAEKERRIWAKIGREVGEFKDGDLGWKMCSMYHTREAKNLKNWYEKGILKGFHPTETFVIFEDND